MNLAALEPTSSPPATGAHGRFHLLASACLRAIVGLARAIVHRREVGCLLELDDRALKDIGLTRGDVVGALSVPVTRDPSVLLRLRAVERRAVRRLTVAPSGRVKARVEA